MDLPLVKITWLDALSHGNAGWNARKDIEEQEPVEIVSTGYLLVDKKSHVTVVGSMTADGDVGGDMTIPRKMVLRVEYLELKPVQANDASE
jgi:hypothetical protein